MLNNQVMSVYFQHVCELIFIVTEETLYCKKIVADFLKSIFKFQNIAQESRNIGAARSGFCGEVR
jgi:hypothetical protein